MEFKDLEEPLYTSDPWYDLFDGGYLDPEEILKNESDVRAIRNAMWVIQAYLDEAQEAGAIEIN